MRVLPAAHQPGLSARAFALGGATLFAASLAYFLWFYLAGLARRGPAASTVAAMTVNTAAFAMFAVHHSVFARARVRARFARLVSPHLERAVYVWIASIMFALLCAIWMPFGTALWDTSGAARWFLRALQGAGIVVSLVAAGALDALALAGIRQLDAPLPGSGVEPATLRSSGLYGVVRHPIYLGWLLIVWPAPTMTPAHLLFAGLSTIYLVIAMTFEERGLRDAFGPAYAAYETRVPRKLIPGIF